MENDNMPEDSLEMQTVLLLRVMPKPSGYVNTAGRFAILSLDDIQGRKLTKTYYFRVEDIDTHIDALAKLRDEFRSKLSVSSSSHGPGCFCVECLPTKRDLDKAEQAVDSEGDLGNKQYESQSV